MKKKNLLALSALVLSLGLTVSSCAGQPGATGPAGDKGPQGDKGEQGEPGKDGQDGKSFADIIVNGWEVTGGTIEQDKYFVERGKKESVTFTFVPETDDKEVVLNIEINGAVVNPVLELVPGEDGKVTWSYEVGDDMGGVQLTSATFTTVKDYAYDIVYAKLAELKAADPLLIGGVEGVSVEVKTTNDKDYSGAQYADSTLFTTSLANSKKAIDEVVKNFKETDTVADKLAAVKTAAETEVTKIEEAYQELVTDAKEDAIAELTSLNNTVTDTHYTDEDSKTILDSAKATVNEATSLTEISAVVNDSKTEKVPLGSFNQLVAAKNSAFATVQAAYDSIVTNESVLKDAESDEYKKLEENIKSWGLDVGTLPTSIYENAMKEISAATSFELDDDDNIVMAKTASEQILNSVETLKDDLVEAITNSYFKIVDDSVALASNSKVVVKSAIEQATTDFVHDDKDLTDPDSKGTYKALSKYASSDASDTTTLVGAIEDAISIAKCPAANEAFQAERLQVQIKAAKDAFAAQVKALKDADATLASVNGGSVKDPTDKTANAVDVYKTTQYLGTDASETTRKYSIDNPFVTSKDDVVDYTPENATKPSYYYTTEDNLVGSKKVDGAKLNLDWQLNNLGDILDEGGEVTEDSKEYNLDTAAGIISYQAAHINDFETLYKEMLEKYSTAQKTASIRDVSNSTGLTADPKGGFATRGELIINSKATTSGTTTTYSYDETKDLAKFVNKDVVTDAWDAKVEDASTLGAVSTLAKGTRDSVNLLIALDNELTSFLGKDKSLTPSSPATGLFVEDPEYVEWVNEKPESSVLYEEAISGANSMVTKILNGEVTSADEVSRWANGLDNVYAKDIATYLSDTKEALQEIYQNKIGNGTITDTEKYVALRNDYNGWLNLVGHIVKLPDETDGTVDSNLLSKNIKVEDDADLSKAKRADSGIYTVENKDGTKDLYLDLRCETKGSVDVFNAWVMAALNGNGNGASAPSGVISVLDPTVEAKVYQLVGTNLTIKFVTNNAEQLTQAKLDEAIKTVTENMQPNDGQINVTLSGSGTNFEGTVSSNPRLRAILSAVEQALTTKSIDSQYVDYVVEFNVAVGYDDGSTKNPTITEKTDTNNLVTVSGNKVSFTGTKTEIEDVNSANIVLTLKVGDTDLVVTIK